MVNIKQNRCVSAPEWLGGLLGTHVQVTFDHAFPCEHKTLSTQRVVGTTVKGTPLGEAVGDWCGEYVWPNTVGVREVGELEAGVAIGDFDGDEVLVDG